MRIGITGSAGFIGRALRNNLREQGHVSRRFDIAEVKGEDVRNKETVHYWIGDGEFDVVVHLAAEVGKLNCEQNPALAIETNVLGTLNVATACAHYGVPLVYCSTSEVYGDQKEWTVAEDHRNSTGYGMSGVYGLTKRWGEEICELYAPKNLKIIRPTMPYGPGVPPGPGRRALDNLVWQAITGQPMVVHHGAARSWCWIDDVASGIRTVIEKGQPGVYNVGRDDDEVPMFKLAEKICATVGRQEGLLFHDLVDLIQVVDPPARQTAVKRISCAKLRALGWEPRTSLEEGLPRMVEWMKEWALEGQVA